MRTFRVVACLVAVLSVTACTQKEEARSVRFYMENELEREDMIARCNADGGRLRGSPDCTNASVASSRLGAKKFKEEKARLEAESQRQLAAMRARQQRLEQEQERLARQLAELSGGADDPNTEAAKSYGAPTSTPVFGENAPGQDASLPPVIGYESETPEAVPLANSDSLVVSMEPEPPVQNTPVIGQQPDVPVQQAPQEEWVVTPSQVQSASETAPQLPRVEVPVRDPSTISLDDLPGASTEPAGASVAQPLQQAIQAVQPADEETEEQPAE